MTNIQLQKVDATRSDIFDWWIFRTSDNVLRVINISPWLYAAYNSHLFRNWQKHRQLALQKEGDGEVFIEPEQYSGASQFACPETAYFIRRSDKCVKYD